MKDHPILISCPACKAQVSNQAHFCPRCGQPSDDREQNINTQSGNKSRRLSFTETPSFSQRLKSLSLGQKVGIGASLVLLIFLIAVYDASDLSIKKADQNGRVNVNTPTQATPSPQPTNLNVNDPITIERRLQGEKIYNRIEAKYHLPLAFSSTTRFPMTLSILAPIGEWNKLSKKDQVNFSHFAEHFVSVVRANPRRYLDKWKQFAGWPTGTEYDDYIRKISAMCDQCWNITVGRIVKEGGRPDFEDSDTPVSGEDVIQFRQSAGKEIPENMQAQANPSAEFHDLKDQRSNQAATTTTASSDTSREMGERELMSADMVAKFIILGAPDAYSAENLKVVKATPRKVTSNSYRVTVVYRLGERVWQRDFLVKRAPDNSGWLNPFPLFRIN